ncbi:hypothetical protein C8R45DRAFT_1192719 [Mycena sanguinolenta]|nr:hypothetical protein C8R45DRAFT_1192719 [Mycena sanguinolenta]
MPVLTRRTAKSILRWLPNEVLAAVMSYSSTSDLIALCTASRLFHAIAVRVLYHTVNLSSNVQLDAFLRTMESCDTSTTSLLTRLRLPDLVRRFALNESWNGEPHHIRQRRWNLAPQAKALASLLSELPHLKSVELIVGYTVKLADKLLERGNFKKLSEFSYTAHSQQEIPALLLPFLNRHPTITNLAFQYDGPQQQPSLAVAIHLPNLTSYFGHSVFISLFQTATMRFVTSVCLISTRLRDLDIEPVLMRLSKMATLRQLIVFHDMKNATLLEIVARHTPRIQILYLVGGRVRALMSPEETLEIAACLPKFDNLRNLMFTGDGGDHDAFATITLWGKACQTLSTIGLHIGNEEKVIECEDDSS